MIDDKKIEEAARDYINKNGYFVKYDEDPCVDIEFAYKEGAKWMQEELLKGLWHPASEEPKKVKNLLLETTYEYGKPIYHLIKYMPNGNNVCAWREWYKGAHISRWLYIDDLLPKEGGNHD